MKPFLCLQNYFSNDDSFIGFQTPYRTSGGNRRFLIRVIFIRGEFEMGFNIFVYGLTGNTYGGGRGSFHYSKENCLDRGDFDPPVLLSKIPSAPTAAGLAAKAAGSPESHLAGGVIAGMSKIAEFQFAHLVRTGVDLLAMHGSGGEISVYCAQKSWYWADVTSYVTFKFSGSNNPGRDFLKAIGPVLKKTELNNFGVLNQIALVLSNYDRELPDSASPHLSISLSH